MSHPVRVAEEVGPKEMGVGQGRLGQFVPQPGPWPSVLPEARPTGLPTASFPVAAAQAAPAFRCAARADGPSVDSSASGWGPYPSLTLRGTVRPQKGPFGSPRLLVWTTPCHSCCLLTSSPCPAGPWLCQAAACSLWVCSLIAPSTWDAPSLPLQCHSPFKVQCQPSLLQAVLPAHGPSWLPPSRLLVRAAAWGPQTPQWAEI